jgi:hypothetical protein
MSISDITSALDILKKDLNSQVGGQQTDLAAYNTMTTGEYPVTFAEVIESTDKIVAGVLKEGFKNSEKYTDNSYPSYEKTVALKVQELQKTYGKEDVDVAILAFQAKETLKELGASQLVVGDGKTSTAGVGQKSKDTDGLNVG